MPVIRHFQSLLQDTLSEARQALLALKSGDQWMAQQKIKNVIEYLNGDRE